jgi:tRNA (adenine37-N6)-methyltransferase
MTDKEPRPGEIALPFDPAKTANDDAVVFIGRIRSPWKTKAECPRNMGQARERGKAATIEIDDIWRPGLMGLQRSTHAVVLYWMQEARRDLIVQSPRRRSDTAGVFALRSPARPNPIALATVRIMSVDQTAGRIAIDAIDCLDGTPLLDIKPWSASVEGIATDAKS